MSQETLEHEIKKLEARLEDLEEERRFVLMSTGVHLPVGTVEKYEVEVESLRGKIEEMRRRLKIKD